MRREHIRVGIASLWPCFVVATVFGCAQPHTSTPPKPASTTPWPRDLSAHLGKRLTLEGTPADSKLGALVLDGDRQHIWIDGLDDWPEEIVSEGKGKRLRVTGTVIRRDDLPVFVSRPGEPPPGGIPVSSEEERERKKWRFLLAEATWVVLD